MTITKTDAKNLESCDIIRFYGTSGAPTDAETAAAAPELCIAKSSAGDTYDLAYDDNAAEFILTKKES